jgi:2-oxoglutarate dehydrogenase complex dehydrogenase (E1) component-like enzyme
VCYRRYGHNEADEPAFTQPRMYALIDAHRSVRKLYTEQLINRGDLTLEEAEAAFADFRRRLDQAFEETHQSGPPTGEVRAILVPDRPVVATAVPRDVLAKVVDGITNRPDGFTVHPKLERILQAHRVAFDRDEVDWSLAEAAAFGSMVLEGTPVRLSGQDTRRGTFSQRHGVLIDVNTEKEYFPLANLSPDQAPFMLYDSVLSEYAALGFEYGYSVSAPGSFVGWEAQFGDFINGAQIVVDQFIAAAEDKWGQRSALTLLLPHAYEGQGPEHSSARMERFLDMCAEDNMRVVYPSTAAQYFHVLRRQVKDALRRPLIVFTPKRYLRMPHTRSPVAALTDDRFHDVLDDRAAETLDREAVRRVVLCTGKIGHELMDRRDKSGAPAAIVRMEQLYPFPENEINEVLGRYPNATQVWWVQEEPENMGAWTFVHGRLHKLLRDRDLRHIARDASASPASGSQTVHDREQDELLERALADL